MTNPADKGAPAAAKPAASGALSDRPVPRLLHQLMRKKVTGCLVITDDTGIESRVFLREGAPVHVVRPTDIDRLDHVVAESGLVSPDILREVSVALPPGRRLGEVLVERGLIAEAALADLLKLQMRRKLARLFHARGGRYDIFLDAHPYGAGGEFQEMRVDPRCLVYDGIRRAYDEARLRAELAPLRGRRFRLLRAVPGSLLEAMGFPPGDPTLAVLEAGPRTLDELPPAGTDLVAALAVVLALLYTDLIEAEAAVPEAGAPMRAPTGAYAVGGGSSVGMAALRAGASSTTLPVTSPRPTGAPAPAAPPPRTTGAMPVLPPSATPARTTASMPAVGAVAGGRSTAALPVAGAPAAAARPGPTGDEALGARIDELLARIDEVSHFELLGVSENASVEEISAAFLRRMRDFHPDRLTGRGQHDMAAKAARLVARINEANVVLQDPRQRAAYIASRAPGAINPADMARAVLNAEDAFRRGELALKRGDYAPAQEAFAQAMRESPQEPIYRAYAAFARFQAPGANKDRLVRETIIELGNVLTERPKFALARHWQGLLYKHLGDLTAAEAAFRAAVADDKTLLDAEREMRILEMRRVRAATLAAANPDKPATATAARKPGSITGRFLKR